MKCISIRQPWALLVCAGIKTIENRTWQTPFRGTVAIHTGAFSKAVDTLVSPSLRSLFSFGSIIGSVDLANVVPRSEVDDNPWSEGPYCFKLENPKLFVQPIAHKGRVGISTLDQDVADLVTVRTQDCLDVSTVPGFVALRESVLPGPIEKSFLRRIESFGRRH